MSDKLWLKSGPIPPEHWDGEPSPLQYASAEEAQWQRLMAARMARINATLAQDAEQWQEQRMPSGEKPSE